MSCGKKILCFIIAMVAVVYSTICSTFFLIQKCPRINLELDYLGIIIAFLSVIVAVFVAVQIYQSITLKRDIDEQNKKLLEDSRKEIERSFVNINSRIEGIQKDTNRIISEKTEEYARELQYDIDRNFITEESAICEIMLKLKKWDILLPFVRLSTKRRLRLFELGYKDMSVETFSGSVAQFINEAGPDFLKKPEFASFMDIFKDLERYESNVSNVYKSYKDNVASAPKEQAPLMGTVQPTK